MRNKTLENKTFDGYLRNIEKVWKLKDQAYQETEKMSSESYWEHIHSEVVSTLGSLNKD